MRDGLRHHLGQYATYRATFARYGKRVHADGSEWLTVLLRNIQDGRGNPMADHQWFQDYHPFMPLRLVPGDRLEFRAVVMPYAKRGGKEDLKLSRLSDLRKIALK